MRTRNSLAYALGRLTVFLVASTILGCASHTLPSQSMASEDQAFPLRLDLRTNQPAYRLGEPVTLTLRATNPTPRQVSLTAPTSQLYDFSVYHGERQVWRWSAGKAFLMVITELSIPAGQSRAFTEVWDQRDQEGRQVPPGEYRVVGNLVAAEQLGEKPLATRIVIR